MNWLLLLHNIPPTPAYLRAKILRRLGQVGALPVKNSAYLLPDTEDTREDFEWICREIRNAGGAVWLFRAEALAGSTAEELVAAFRNLRTSDYEDLIGAAGSLAEGEVAPADHARLSTRLEQIVGIDFFEHPLRAEAVRLVAQLAPPDSRLRQGEATPTGGIWVTRKGIKVDRIASAWLIRRFLDPQATFRFVDTADYVRTPPEIRFDMFEGEFTHEGNLCTFEVLVARHRLAEHEPGLRAIAETVHDLDLKDGLYSRPETQGLGRMLDGLCARTSDDMTRLELGGQFFDSLLGSFI